MLPHEIILTNFKFKNCLFAATSMAKNSDKENMCMVDME